MTLDSAYRTVRTKVTVAKNRALSPANILKVAAAPKRKPRARRKKDIWTGITRAFFVTVAVLLLCCTSIDILHQSFSSGQFWNSIIVVVCLGIILVWSLGLNLVRQIDTNRWVAAIPRRHQVGRSDIGGRMMAQILDVRQRCISLFKNQRDFSLVEHAGLQNPLRRHGGDGGEGDIESSYWEFADTIPVFLEDNFTILMPGFTIKQGSTLRDYIGLAIDEKLIDPTHMVPTIERFLDLYEKLRYSGVSMSHAELIELMDALRKILNEIQQPDFNPSYQTPRRATPRGSIPTRSYSASPFFGRTISSSTYGSVKRYPSRNSTASNDDTIGSQLSLNSHSSRISPRHRFKSH